MAKKKTKKKGLSLQSKILKQVVGLKKRPSNKPIRVGRKPIKLKSNPTLELSQTRGLPEKESLHQLCNMMMDASIRIQSIECKFPMDFRIKSNERYMDSPHGLDFDLAFESIILKSFSKEISRFINLSSEYDSHLLLSNLRDAELILQQIFDEFGYSNWYISSKLNLLHEKGLHSESEEFRNDVTDFFKHNKSNSLSEVYSNYPFIRCDKSVSFERYSFSIQHQSEEYSDTGNIDIIHFSHFFSPSSKYIEYSDIISENSANNIVDRYLGYRRILFSLYLNDIIPSKHLEWISNLSKEIEDKSLKNIVSLIVKGKITQDSYDDALIKICDLYVQGRYTDVIDESEKLLLVNPSFVSINEIYIKSLIRCDTSSKLNNLLGLICDEILCLYTSSDKRKSIATLHKYYLRFYHTDWAYFIKLHCEKFSHNLEQSNLEKTYGYVDIYSSLMNPFTRLNFSMKNSKNSLSQKVLLDCESYYLDRIDINRKLKILGDNHYKEKQYEQCIEYYKTLSVSDDFLFSDHAKSKLISCYYYLCEYEKAISCLSGLIVNGQGQNLLPIKRIYQHIYKEDKGNLSESKLVDRAIIADQYYKLLGSKDGDILGLLCEDILDAMGINGASEIYIPDGDSFSYFFNEVMQPSALEKIDIFESSDEVYIFRFYIIKSLLTKHDDIELREDLFRNLEKLIKETCVTECGIGKIEVDFLSVKNSLVKRLGKTFNAIKNSEKESISETDYTEISTDKGTYTVSRNKYFVDVLDFYLQVRDVFTLSPTNGLDYFLNMNIRHGGIVNLLWGPAKKHNLCYIKTDKGQFEKNQYWFDHNPYMLPNTRNELDDALRNFSIGLDNKIQEIKSYIHINTGEFDDKDKAFNYFSDQYFIEELMESITSESSVEEILDSIIGNLVEVTNKSLESLKEYINYTYREDVNLLFESLKKITVNPQCRFEELNRKIRLAQREMNEKLDELMEWMEWKNEASQSFLLGSSVDAAKEMVTNLHPNRKVEVVFQDTYKRFIKGEHFRRFVMIFLILLDNAIVHSRDERAVNIYVDIDKHIDEVRVTILNDIGPEDCRVSLEKIRAINDKVNLTYIDDANKESGSGIFKVKKIISSDMKSNNIIYLNLESQVFSVVLHIDEKGVLDENY
nr:hypothetical protein [Vibrio parahaemolyticus]